MVIFFFILSKFWLNIVFLFEILEYKIKLDWCIYLIFNFVNIYDKEIIWEILNFKSVLMVNNRVDF